VVRCFICLPRRPALFPFFFPLLEIWCPPQVALKFWSAGPSETSAVLPGRLPKNPNPSRPRLKAKCKRPLQSAATTLRAFAALLSFPLSFVLRPSGQASVDWFYRGRISSPAYLTFLPAWDCEFLLPFPRSCYFSCDPRAFEGGPCTGGGVFCPEFGPLSEEFYCFARLGSHLEGPHHNGSVFLAV